MEISALFIITISISVICFSQKKLLSQLVLFPYKIFKHNQWYRCISYGFVHANYIHLIFNMLTLWFFYKPLFSFFYQTTSYPNVVFYCFYLFILLTSVIPQTLINRNNAQYVGLGASGAVVGVVLSVILIIPNSKIGIFILPPIIPAYIFGIAFVVISLVLALRKKKGDNIDHLTHVFGAFMGLVALWIYSKIVGYHLWDSFMNQIF